MVPRTLNPLDKASTLYDEFVYSWSPKLICKILDLPIISTSANISGDDPIIKQEDLEIYFRDNMDNIDYIIDGLVGNSKKPSRILDLVSKDVIREGG